jgi:hypothetical protein
MRKAIINAAIEGDLIRGSRRGGRLTALDLPRAVVLTALFGNEKALKAHRNTKLVAMW